eukprot:404637_1
MFHLGIYLLFTLSHLTVGHNFTALPSEIHPRIHKFLSQAEEIKVSNLNRRTRTSYRTNMDDAIDSIQSNLKHVTNETTEKCIQIIQSIMQNSFRCGRTKQFNSIDVSNETTEERSQIVQSMQNPNPTSNDSNGNVSVPSVSNSKCCIDPAKRLFFYPKLPSILTLINRANLSAADNMHLLQALGIDVTGYSDPLTLSGTLFHLLQEMSMKLLFYLYPENIKSGHYLSNDWVAIMNCVFYLKLMEHRDQINTTEATVMLDPHFIRTLLGKLVKDLNATEVPSRMFEQMYRQHSLQLVSLSSGKQIRAKYFLNTSVGITLQCFAEFILIVMENQEKLLNAQCEREQYELRWPWTWVVYQTTKWLYNTGSQREAGRMISALKSSFFSDARRGEDCQWLTDFLRNEMSRMLWVNEDQEDKQSRHKFDDWVCLQLEQPGLHSELKRKRLIQRM